MLNRRKEISRVPSATDDPTEQIAIGTF